MILKLLALHLFILDYWLLFNAANVIFEEIVLKLHDWLLLICLINVLCLLFRLLLHSLKRIGFVFDSYRFCGILWFVLDDFVLDGWRVVFDYLVIIVAANHTFLSWQVYI